MRAAFRCHISLKTTLLGHFIIWTYMQDQYWLYGRLCLQNSILYLYLKGMFTRMYQGFGLINIISSVIVLESCSWSRRTEMSCRIFLFFLPSLISVKRLNVYRSFLYELFIQSCSPWRADQTFDSFNIIFEPVFQKDLCTFSIPTHYYEAHAVQYVTTLLTVSVTVYLLNDSVVLQTFNFTVFSLHRQSTAFQCLELDVKWSLFSVFILNSGRTFFLPSFFYDVSRCLSYILSWRAPRQTHEPCTIFMSFCLRTELWQPCMT